MTLPHGWIEVHGWSAHNGYHAQTPAQRLLLQVRHIWAVTPECYDGRLVTHLWFGKYSHVVEESVVQVQALMVAAMVGCEDKYQEI